MANKKEKKTPEVEVVEEVTPKAKEVTGVVSNCDKLRIRKKPNTDSEVLGLIDKGAEVTIHVDLAKNDDFYVVTYVNADGESITGHSMKEFITINK